MSGKTASSRAAVRQSRTKYGRRRKPEQMDLFGSGQSSVVIGSPAWPELPAETRATLTGLMVRLILQHAGANRPGSSPEAGHDL